MCVLLRLAYVTRLSVLRAQPPGRLRKGLPLQGWIPHCVHTPPVPCPLTRQWTLRWCPPLGAVDLGYRQLFRVLTLIVPDKRQKWGCRTPCGLHSEFWRPPHTGPCGGCTPSHLPTVREAPSSPTRVVAPGLDGTMTGLRWHLLWLCLAFP